MNQTKKALPILFAVMFLVMAGFGIIIPVLPFYAEDIRGFTYTIRLPYGCIFSNTTNICTYVGTCFRPNRSEAGYYDWDIRVSDFLFLNWNFNRTLDAICCKNPWGNLIKRKYAYRNGLCSRYHYP